MDTKIHVVSIRLTNEQFHTLTEWQQRMTQAIGMEVRLGALIRRLIDDSLTRGYEGLRLPLADDLNARDENDDFLVTETGEID